MFGNKRKRRLAERLVETGGRGIGTIVAIQDTGITINNNPRVRLIFEIQPLDGSGPFRAEKKATVSRIAVPVPGMRHPVYYDLDDPQTFIFVATVDGPSGRDKVVADFGTAFGRDAENVGLVAAAT